MKKFKLLLLGAILTSAVISCGGSEGEIEEASVSSKGDWNKENKEKAMDAMDEIKDELAESMGRKEANDYLDCYLGKLEDNYPNFRSADKDFEGCGELAAECMEELGLSMSAASTYGAWSEDDIEKAKKEINSMRDQMEAILGDKTDDYLECYLDAVELNYPDFATANGDLDGCTVLATECMENL